MDFCSVCNNPVQLGVVKLSCRECQGCHVNIKQHPHHDEIIQREIAKWRDIHTRCAEVFKPFVLAKLRRLGVSEDELPKDE